MMLLQNHSPNCMAGAGAAGAAAGGTVVADVDDHTHNFLLRDVDDGGSLRHFRLRETQVDSA